MTTEISTTSSILAKEKILYSADWQIIPGDSAQLAAQTNMLKSMETHKADWGMHNGDVLEKASENDTGMSPGYTYSDLFRDMSEHMPSTPPNRWFFIPGNHDRDGWGIQNHEKAWSYRTYRQALGREFYFTKKGNILRVHMGDMAGSTGGEIFKFVTEWFAEVVHGHPNYNIEVYLHQPLTGTHPGLTDAKWFQEYSERISVEVLDTVDNVAAVFYGHVGNIKDIATDKSSAHGTEHIPLMVGIPTRFNATPPEDLCYGVMELENGASTADLRVYNATQDAWESGAQVTIHYKFPISLGSEDFDHDGRTNDHADFSIGRGPTRRYAGIDDDRELVGGNWQAKVKTHWLYDAILVDATENIPAGLGVGYRAFIPGAEWKILEGNGEVQTTADPGYGFAGGLYWEKVNAKDADFTSQWKIQARIMEFDPDGEVTRDDHVVGLEFNPQTGGITAPNGISVSAGADPLTIHKGPTALSLDIADAESGGSVSNTKFVGSWHQIGRLVSFMINAANIDTSNLTATNNLIVRPGVLPMPETESVFPVEVSHYTGVAERLNARFKPVGSGTGAGNIFVLEQRNNAGSVIMNAGDITHGLADIYISGSYIAA